MARETVDAARVPQALDHVAEVFELEYVDDDGQRRQALARCWDRRFELAVPSRRFPVYQGQKSFSGWWWAATTGEHVAYESWLERSVVVRLDYDPEIVGLAAQPFGCTGTAAAGRGGMRWTTSRGAPTARPW
jgi:hypothetical protein